MQLDDYWTNIGIESSQVSTGPAVSLTLIAIEPLDSQFGEYPLLTVPDALKDIFQFNDMQLFVVLDGAKIQGLPEILAGDRAPFKCLYRGHLAKELRDVAPYLVEVQADAPLLRQSFTRADPKQYWWDFGATIYLQSRDNLNDIAEHLRTLVALNDEVGKVRYLRFWDAPVLHRILAATTPDFLDPLHFFNSKSGTSIQAIILPDPLQDTVAIAVPHAQSPQGRLRYTPNLTQVLKEQARDAFALTLIAHCASKFPKTVKRLPEVARRDLILESIKEAKDLNITKRGPVTSFTELRLVLGAGMADDPMYPWVSDVLQRVTLQNQMAAMEALVSRFAEYTIKVNGAENSHFNKALKRARDALDAPDEKSYSDLLRRVYPEKFHILGDEGVKVFLISIRRQLAPFPNLDQGSIRAFVLLCFFMGHRCAEDPQYDWITQALARGAQEAAGPLERPLVRKSKTWSEAILKTVTEQ